MRNQIIDLENHQAHHSEKKTTKCPPRSIPEGGSIWRGQTDTPINHHYLGEVPSAIMDAKTTRSVYGDGSFGGAYRASDEVMDEIFAACVQDILQLLAFE